MFGVSVILIIISVLLYINWKKKNNLYPPGPVNWLGIGSFLAIHNADPVYPHEAFRKLAKKYGPIMSLTLGAHNAVIFSKYEDIQEIFKKDEFNGRYQFPTFLDRSYGKELGILFTSNDVWRTVRKFTAKSLRDKGFRNPEVLGKKINEEWTDFALEFKKEAAANGGVIQFNSNFSALVVSVIWSYVFGFRYKQSEELFQQFLDTTDDIVKALAFNNINLLFPFFRKIVPRLTGHNRDMAVYTKHLKIFKELLDVAKEYNTGDNLYQAFQSEIDKNSGNMNTHFTEEQMIVTLLDIFLAGSETTNHFIGFGILHMVLNPDMQDKMYEEICKVVPDKNEIPSYADIERMSYTQAFMFEIFRYCNIVPIPLARQCSVDFDYKGFIIPKGACIMYNLHCVFNDPEYWGDPQNFRPDRFLDSNGNLTKTERIIVFGVGKRICIGDIVAKQTGFIYLAALIKNFKFEIIPNEPPPSPKPQPSSFTSRPHPFKSIIIPREYF